MRAVLHPDYGSSVAVELRRDSSRAQLLSKRLYPRLAIYSVQLRNRALLLQMSKKTKGYFFVVGESLISAILSFYSFILVRLGLAIVCLGRMICLVFGVSLC